MKYMQRFACCLLSVALLWSLFSCQMYGTRKVADETYLKARRDTMSVTRPEGSKDYFIYTVMVDIDAGDHVETLVCCADGTTHLYLSTGEQYLHLEKETPAIVGAAQALLTCLGENINHALWVSKTDLALPDMGTDRLYLAGDKGIYILTIDPAGLSEASEAINTIHELYCAVYTLADSAVDTQA